MSQKTSNKVSEGSPAKDTRQATTNWPVFIGAAAGSLAITLWALLARQQAQDVLSAAVAWTADWFGWFYVLLATVVLVFVIFIAVSRHGKVKLGPEHSKPEFSTFAWASMLFAAGIGSDLMFFAVAEPVTLYMQPPSGAAETVDAAREATVWTLFHYGISGWGMYALMGMVLAYFAYRKGLPLAIRSALSPIFGKRVQGRLGDAVDIAALLGTIFGVATSLGIGVVMVNVGLNVVLGVPTNTGVQIAIVAVGVCVATLSAVTGVDRGIKFLSQLNVLLAVGLTVWVLIAGKTQYLLESLVLNIGDFVRLFPNMAMQTFPFEDTGTWMADWTLFFWAWWIAWASFVGLFLARISRGRTIRQFVSGTLTIPFVYILMWVSIYGNSALDLIRSGDREFAEDTIIFPEGGFYTLLSEYPGFMFIAGLATLTALLFYVTSADSAALVMANLSSRLPTPQHDGQPRLRIFWALSTGALTIAMLLVGGIGALQNATVIMGLPFGFVMILVMIGFYRALRVESYRLDSEEQSLPALLSTRSTTARRPHQDWRKRLGHALTFPDDRDATKYEEQVLLPVLLDLVDELEARGVHAKAGPRTDDNDERYVELVVDEAGEHPFHYQVWRRSVPVPAFGGRFIRGTDRHVRMEVFLDGGSVQGYDILGFNPDQLAGDVLDQYERHLGFLQIQEEDILSP